MVTTYKPKKWVLEHYGLNHFVTQILQFEFSQVQKDHALPWSFWLSQK